MTSRWGRRTLWRTPLIGLLAFVTTGCAKEPAVPRGIQAIMQGPMDEAVDGIWSRAGYVITAAGEESLYPETDEEWQAVIASAEELAAVAATLKEPANAYDNLDWMVISDGLIAASMRAKAAAEARDKQELFDAGGHIYRVCRSCHQRYAPGMAGEFN